MAKKTVTEKTSSSININTFLSKNILKVLVSLTLIVILLSKIDISATVLLLKEINIQLYFLAIFLGFSSISIISYRCKYLCKKKIDVKIPLLKCYIYYFLASFYSNFLPTAIGGDVFRIYYLNKHIKNVSNSSSIVLFERISGFFSLIFIALIASIILYINYDKREFLLQTFIIAFILTSCLLLILNQKLEAKICNLMEKINFTFIVDYIKTINDNIRSFLKDYNIAKNIFFHSLTYQLSTIIIACIYGSSLGIKVPLTFYFVLMPITYFVTMIPISFAGIGLREVTIVSLFALVGVTSHAAISLSFLLYLEILLKGVVGGTILLLINTNRSKNKIKEIILDYF